MSDPAIEVRGLVKRYGESVAVDGLDLDIRRGEIFALLGPNGAGKTTTVEILEGFRRRDGGEVSVLGVDPNGAGRDCGAHWFAPISDPAAPPNVVAGDRPGRPSEAPSWAWPIIAR